MSETNINLGQAAVVGSNATVRDVTQIQRSQALDKADLQSLIGELQRLREALNNEAPSLERDMALGEVAKAASEASKGTDADRSKIFEALKNGGAWLADFAQKVGIPIITEVIKDSLGLRTP